MSAGGLAKALAAFQAELPSVGKDQAVSTGSYSYSYADLTKISEKAYPLLSKHGLAFSAQPTMSDHGFVLEYMLMHVDGSELGGSYPLPDPSKSTAQQIGSAITYARRYCLCAVTGIAPGGEDDDGKAAQDATPAAKRGRAQPAADPLAEARRAVWAARLPGWDQSDIEEDYAREHDGQVFTSAGVAELYVYRDLLLAGRK